MCLAVGGSVVPVVSLAVPRIAMTCFCDHEGFVSFGARKALRAAPIAVGCIAVVAVLDIGPNESVAAPIETTRGKTGVGRVLGRIVALFAGVDLPVAALGAGVAVLGTGVLAVAPTGRAGRIRKAA